MERAKPIPVMSYLRLAVTPGGAGIGDGDLLDRFAKNRDQAAFELLVWRYSAMVHRACLMVLRDHHAAEDACQAAFLVLARKAGSISKREAIAGWLYRVAHRIAVRLAVQRAQRRTFSSSRLDEIPDATRQPFDEAVPLMHEEIARLPDRYRTPVLLCFLEGLTHAEAAQRLNWPIGTVAGRVARAKSILHRRLSQRGLPALSLMALATGFERTSAARSPSLIAATRQAALSYIARKSVVHSPTSTQVLLLANGAVRTMTVAKLKWAACTALLAGSLLTGGVWAVAQVPGGTSPAEEPKGTSLAKAAPSKEPKPSTKLRELQKERIKALEEHIDGLFDRIKIGKSNLLTLFNTYGELLDAKLELAETPAAELAALEGALKQFEEIEKKVVQLEIAGIMAKQDAAQARAARLKAEIRLEKWKARR